MSQTVDTDSQLARSLLKHGDRVIGHLTIDSTDTFLVIGDLSPGPDFKEYESLFEQLILPEEDPHAAEDEYEAEDYLQWEKACIEVNDMDLVLVDEGTGEVEPIRDFSFISRWRAEFKLDVSPKADAPL